MHDLVPQESHFLSSKETLARLQLHAGASDPVEHLFQRFQVTFFRAVENNDVINVDQARFAVHPCQNQLHKLLKRWSSIFKAKGHDLEMVETFPRCEGSLLSPCPPELFRPANILTPCPARKNILLLPVYPAHRPPGEEDETFLE